MIYNPDIISKQYVERELKTYQIPGMGVSVQKDGELLVHTGFGYQDLEKKIEMTNRSHWCIASCTKAFTATLIAMLVDRGSLQYDQPIIEYLPDFQLYDAEATRKCTIRDMLLHRTGLSEHDALWTDTISRGELFNRLKFLKPRAPFRQQMIYNNTVYTAIGYIAERLSGLSWEEMIQRWILEPLEMHSSGTTLTELANRKDVAVPYWNRGGKIKKLNFWNISPGEPCAGITTCLDDAIKWALFNLQKGSWKGTQLVSSAQMENTHKMQIPTKLWPWEWDGLPADGSYALGWFGCVYKGEEVVFHLGEIEGYCTLIGFLPQQNIAYASFVNLHKPCVFTLFSVFFTVLDNLLELEKTDWYTKFNSKTGQFGEFYTNSSWDLLEGCQPSAVAHPSHALEDYVGIYRNDGYGTCEIRCVDGELQAFYRNMIQKMEHFHYDTFKIIDVKEDTFLLTAPLTFHTDPYTGNIQKFSVDLDPLSDTITFNRK